MANNLTPKEEFLLNPVTEHNITDAAIASFETNLRHPLKVTVPLEPKQDLHGYDRPWPAGGGKNLVNPNGLTYEQYNSAGNMYSDSKGVSTTFLPVVPGETYTASVNQEFYSLQLIQFDAEKTWIKNSLASRRSNYTVPLESTTAYVRLIGILDNTTIMQVETFISTYHPQLELGSTATSYEPYENICPIEGWTEANVTGAAKNIFGGIALKNALLATNSTASAVGNDVTFKAVANFGDPLFSKFKPNTQYTFVMRASRATASNNPNICFEYTDGTAGTFSLPDTHNSEVTVVFTTAANKSVKCFRNQPQVYQDMTIYTDRCGIFEGAVTADEFEPYQGTTLPISWKHAEGTYEFTPNQEGSGDPSPTNVRPITPGLTITRDDNTELTVWGGSITFNDDGTSRVDEIFGLFTGIQFTTSGKRTDGFYSRLSFLNDYVRDPSSDSRVICNKAGTVSADFSAWNVYPGGTIGTTNNKYAHVYIPENAIDYHDGDDVTTLLNAAYDATSFDVILPLSSPQSYTLSLTETQRAITALGDKVITTVCVGSIILNEDGSADIVCDYMKRVYDGDNKKPNYKQWAVYSTANGFYTQVLDMKSGFRQNGYASWLNASIDYSNPSIFFGSNNIYIYCTHISDRIPGVTDLASWNAYLAEHPLEVVYPLATPITYHLPNVGQLKAFVGENNVWSDAGNVDVRYLTQNSETGVEYRGDRALELRRRAMMADAPTIRTTVGSEETGGMASFKSYVKAPAKKIEVPFYPKQDLHGYDHPWPGGGGKNLWNPSRTLGEIDPPTTSAETARTFDLSKFYNAFSHTGTYNASYVGDVTYVDGILTIPKSTSMFGVGFPFKLISGSTYTLSWELIQGDVTVYAVSYDSSGVWTAWSYASRSTPAMPKAFTVPDGTETTLIVIRALSNDTVVKNLQLELGSTATDYSPYENICPIEGHDGCEITGCRRNLLNPATPYRSIAYNNASKITSLEDLEAGLDAGQMLFYGLTTGSNVMSFNSTNQVYAVFRDLPTGAYSTSYCKHVRGVNDDLSCDVLDVLNDLDSGEGERYKRRFTVSKHYKYVLIYCHNYAQSSSVNPWTIDDVIENMMVVKGNTVGEYEPYQATTVPLVFNQAGDHEFAPIQDGTGDPSPENVRPIHPGLTFTRDDDSELSVYDGTLTVNADGTGSLVSKFGDTILDENVQITKAISNTHGWYIPCNDMLRMTYYVNNILSNKLKTYNYNGSTGPDGGFVGANIGITGYYANSSYPGQNWFYLKNEQSTTMTTEEILEWLSNNPIQVVYPLATPITYTLSVTETNRALEALGLTQHIGQIYGGTVTINPDGSADVVATGAYADFKQITFTKNNRSTSGYYFYNENITPRCSLNASQLNDARIMEKYTHSVIGNPYNNTGYYAWMYSTPINKSTIRVGFPDETGIETIEDFNAWIAEQDEIGVYYPINPITYHFSNLEQLKVWLGENNFWCDISDDITVKYWNRG